MLLLRPKFFFCIIFFEIIALLGLKSPFSVFSDTRRAVFLDIKKIKIGNCSIYVHKFDFPKILNINGLRPFQPRIFPSAYSSFFLRPRRKYLSTYGECAESIQA